MIGQHLACYFYEPNHDATMKLLLHHTLIFLIIILHSLTTLLNIATVIAKDIGLS